MSDLHTEPPKNPPRTERLLLLPPAELRLGPNAPSNPAAQPSLIESVRTYGVLEPVLARQTPGGLEVVAGFKRVAAAREAGLEEIPVRVYRVDDAAIAAFHAATNLQGERKRYTPPAPSSPGEYNAGGRLTGLLEEELNRPARETPYKFILAAAAVVLLVFWVGLTQCSRRDGVVRVDKGPDPSEEEPVEIMRPRVRDITDSLPADPTPGTPVVAEWRGALREIDGIEVRDESGVPRIVFSSPVFSRLTTIDPNQHRRLNRVAQRVVETSPTSILVVIGHTDNVPVRPGGAFESNTHLGQLRAEEVMQHLVTRAGIPAGRVRAESSGSESPPFPNTPAASKVRNRTVTIEIRNP